LDPSRGSSPAGKEHERGRVGASLGYQLASVFAGGPAPLVATALSAAFGSAHAIAVHILLSAIISIVATALLPDYTNRDISQEHQRV
jgi:hypothetical protein